MAKLPHLIYEFGQYRLDLAECRLLRCGQQIMLRPKLFDLLAVLVERRGQMVGKEELIELVWGAQPERADSVAVYESNLTVSINALRKTLGDEQYIETITRRGYRFTAEVKVVPSEPSVDVLPDPESAGFEPPGGALSLRSQFYIKRHTDEEFNSAILRRDSVVLVKGPRQVGKTSLLARGLQRAREAGAVVVLTDFQHLSSAALASVEQLLPTLAAMIADQLELPVRPRDAWDDFLSPSTNFERYLRREVLAKIPSPLVWAVDEADRIFKYSYASEVFGLFRSWHNLRALDPTGPWRRLTLALAYATEAHLFISDLNQSPFNVGTRLVLEDFTANHMAELNQRYGCPLKNDDEMARFYRLVGGHPYLVQRGLYEMVTRGMDVETVELRADCEEGIFGDHLQRMLVSLERDQALLASLRAFLVEQTVPNLPHFFRLRSAGVLAGESPQNARPRCELYAHFLKKRLL